MLPTRRAGAGLATSADRRYPPFSLALLPLALACIQPVHQDGPDSPPIFGWPAHVLAEHGGHGRQVLGGDRVQVDMKGTYWSGEVWGEGPYTFIAGPGSYPGSVEPLRVGGTIRMQILLNRSDTTARLWSLPGLDTKNEGYQIRRDRGPVIVEHTIRSVCREYKLFLLQTGFGPIETGLGCWPVFRFDGQPINRGMSALERQVAEFEGGRSGPDSTIVDPTPVPRRRADTTQYLGADGLHRAALEGRPELVGWLLRHGRDPMAADSFGFLPIHYVGFAQRPLQRFVPAFEPDYVAVLDTLLAHDVPVDARVRPGVPRMPMHSSKGEDEGQTTLGFAAPECADPLVRRLLERGASPDAMAPPYGTTALAGAAINGCVEILKLLIERGGEVDRDPGGGTPLQRLCAVSMFFQGRHYEAARLLVEAGAGTEVAAKRLEDRLDDPGPGGFGFTNRREARRILQLLRKR